jgi:two-component system sensor histidine kinase CreC
MKHFKLNVGTKLFILYFVISSALVWVFVQRTSMESAKGVLVEVSSLLSKIASQNIKNGEIDITNFDGIVEGYFPSPIASQKSRSNQLLENLAIYITDKDGLLILDSRGLSLGKSMIEQAEVGSALRGKKSISRISVGPARDSRKIWGINTDYFYKPQFLYVSNPIYGNNGEVIGALVVAAPMLDLTAENYLYEFIFYIFLISLFFGILGSYRISRNINRLEKYSTRLFKGDEVSIPDLNIQFNKLALAIQKSHGDVELKDDVEEYINTLAHELRTPITGVRLAAENLKTDMNEDERSDFIRGILDSNKHMDMLVTRLLDLSRVERRDNLSNLVLINVKAIVIGVVKKTSRAGNIAKKYIIIKYEISEDIQLKAERLLFEQAIGNIVNNAIDFSPDGGTITIKATQTNSAVNIVVLDEGPGIPVQVMSKLFTRFFSVSRPDTGKRSTGLGLRFVKKIMQLHGGEITLNNRFFQAGTEAKLRFPLTVK